MVKTDPDTKRCRFRPNPDHLPDPSFTVGASNRLILPMRFVSPLIFPCFVFSHPLIRTAPELWKAKAIKEFMEYGCA